MATQDIPLTQDPTVSAPTQTGKNPTVRDWKHASRVFVDGTYDRAPRNKFLYYVVFNINTNSPYSSVFRNKFGSELNYLVKTADLPKYELNSELLNQYNRKTNVYSKITYQPVTIKIHDDNHGTSNEMWNAYYRHYFQDQNYTFDSTVSPAPFKKTTYKGTPGFLYGFAGAPVEPFFDSIQLITMTKRTFQSYLLCNPKITEWQHDTMDYSENSGVVENTMIIAYDAVIYRSGNVIKDDPTGFATLHYDQGPSPIAGSTTTPTQQSNQDLNPLLNVKQGSFLTPPVNTVNSSLAGSADPAIQQLIAGSSTTPNTIYNTGGIQNIDFGALNALNGTTAGTVLSALGPIGTVAPIISNVINANGGISGTANAISGLFNALTGNGAGSDSAGAPVISQNSNINGYFGSQGTTGAGTSGNTQSDSSSTGGVTPNYNSTLTSSPNAAILAAIQSKESSGNYNAQNPTSSASGAYQYIDSKWQEQANAAGIDISQYGPHAKDAPPEVQDAVASHNIDTILKQTGGDVSKIPVVWLTGNVNGQSKYVTPQQVAEYQQSWLKNYDKISSQPPNDPNQTPPTDANVPTPPSRPTGDELAALGGTSRENSTDPPPDTPVAATDPAGQTVAATNVDTTANPQETYQPDTTTTDVAASESPPSEDFYADI